MAKTNMGPICAVEEPREYRASERFGGVKSSKALPGKKRTEGGPRGEEQSEKGATLGVEGSRSSLEIPGS